MTTTGVVIHRTYFLEEDIYEGDFPRDDVRTDVFEVNASEAAKLLTSEGLSFKGSEYATDPDGSRITNYATGQHVETSAQLVGFPNRVVAAIMDKVG